MTASSFLSKADWAFVAALAAWDAAPDVFPGDGIGVALSFEGEIAAIEALGFQTHRLGPPAGLGAARTARGVVLFKDARTLLADPNVKRIEVGGKRSIDLDTSVADMRVRAANAGDIFTTGMWFCDPAGNLVGRGGGTGAGVIVAIIDSGIDFAHPMFMSQLTPTKQTRILRIWDQGLVPTSRSQCPQVQLTSPDTYGVELTDTQINAALNGGAAIAHRDCDGHGTHVAGIAAGGTRFPAGGDATVVGVAPLADIIAVKVFDNPSPIRVMTAAGLGRQVGSTSSGGSEALQDAVLYCLRTARDLGKPVVINFSAGNSGEPGDGLDTDAVDIDRLLDPAASGPDAFPSGAIVVKSAGNNGDLSQRRTMRVVIPAAGELVLPFELFDNRPGPHTKWKECARRIHRPSVDIHFWYQHVASATAVQVALHLPDGSTWSADAARGDTHEIAFRTSVSPARDTVVATASSSVHVATITHSNLPAVPHPVSGTVHRQHVEINLDPKVSGRDVTYRTGVFEVRVRAPGGTVLWVMCPKETWGGPGNHVHFRLATTMRNGTALPATIAAMLTATSSSVDTFGRHVITVASYNDADGVASAPNRHAIAASSSRGPLRNFSTTSPQQAVIVQKPDVAAPGVNIKSAEGRDTEPRPSVPRTGRWRDGIRFAEHGGTSMATPAVAGLIALMLEKKPDLTVSQARTALTTAPRAAVNPATPPASTEAYGSGMVDGPSSHDAVP